MHPYRLSVIGIGEGVRTLEDCRAEDTILDLKRKIDDICICCGYPADAYRLLYGGKLLHDQCRLSDYSIQSGSTVLAVFRLHGGGPSVLHKTTDGGTPDLADAFRITFPVARDWKSVGVLLNVPAYRLGDIEITENRVPTACLREMLSVWLTQIDPPPTWRSLADVVGHFNQAVAKKIEQQYLSQ